MLRRPHHLLAVLLAAGGLAAGCADSLDTPAPAAAPAGKLTIPTGLVTVGELADMIDSYDAAVRLSLYQHLGGSPADADTSTWDDDITGVAETVLTLHPDGWYSTENSGTSGAHASVVVDGRTYVQYLEADRSPDPTIEPGWYEIDNVDADTATLSSLLFDQFDPDTTLQATDDGYTIDDTNAGAVLALHTDTDRTLIAFTRTIANEPFDPARTTITIDYPSDVDPLAAPDDPAPFPDGASVTRTPAPSPTAAAVEAAMFDLTDVHDLDDINPDWIADAVNGPDDRYRVDVATNDPDTIAFAHTGDGQIRIVLWDDGQCTTMTWAGDPASYLTTTAAADPVDGCVA